MHAPAHDRFPRLAPILLIGVLIVLAIIRPGSLAGETCLLYRVLTTFVATVAVAYISWRFHGIIAAAIAIVLLYVAEASATVSDSFFAFHEGLAHERQTEALLLGTLAIGIAACSRQAKPGRLHWIVITIASCALVVLGWVNLDIRTTNAYPYEHRIRLLQISAGLLVLSTVVGLLKRSVPWRDRLKLIAVLIALPAVGILTVRLVLGGLPLFLEEDGYWQGTFLDWNNFLARGTWKNATWAWTLPWIVVPLLLIGFWRTAIRGWKEWKQGDPPFAWLLTFASLGVLLAIGSEELATGSLALAAIGALLSVFGIADLIQALVERIELKPPTPGISDVPRVR
jgi:hypothetical protein